MRAGLVVVVLAASGGCNNPVYLQEIAPVETMADATNGGYAAGTAFYALPVRQPTDEERQALDSLQQALMLPNAVPWTQARDFDIEIQYSVHNLDTEPLIAFVTLDGGNEYGDYIPANYLDPTQNVDDQAPPPHLISSVPLTIEPDGVATGVFREDELQESAIDLEAITRYPSADGAAATAFQTIEHRSDVSTIGLEGVPAGDITPAHVRYVLTVSAPGHVVMDYVVRVRDHNGKLAKPDDENLYVNAAPP
jgi:hypothetical protein